MAVFQGFLSRALHVCSEKYSAQEIKLLINVFAENENSNTTLKKVTKEHTKNIFSIKENVYTVKNDEKVKVVRYRNWGES